MSNEGLKSIMHPLRLKIVQELSLKGTGTTKELAEICGDIPQATLYRHLRSLLKHGVIKVVAENRVRGILEKVYAIRENPSDEISKRITSLSKEELSELFSQFIISLLSDFNGYLHENEKVDVQKGTMGFRSYPLYLSDEEFQEMLAEINTIIKDRLENKPGKNRMLRKFSTVITTHTNKRG